MNFKVVGDDGKLIATGRDLQVLQQSFKTASVISFEQIAQDELNLTGYIQWAFDTIPNHYHFQKEGQDYLGYPALIDEGETVGLRLLETEFKAQQCHQIGLVRLFQLTLKKERKYLLKNLSLGADVELAYQQLREHPYFAGNVVVQSLKEDFLFLCFREVFVGESVVRCSAEFEQALKKKSTLSEFSIQATTLVRELLKSYLQLSRQLAKQSLPSEVAEEIKSHLNGLIFKGFIREIPYQHLLAYPRYLNAVSYRLEKRLENSQKDQQKLQEISRFNRRYWSSVMKRAEQGPVVPAAENFRWCLEEFRVSLFAQHLKTSYPVSAKRLEKLWDF
jgi:ATP-dependent helicase HrpA